ncbi:hypothetical protein OPFAMLBM_00104 [Aeromonas phage avDM12-TAAL]|nr:hypothetical protein OPFAMLBM_00104 [Aeromonas phage avDM12-TAAL]
MNKIEKTGIGMIVGGLLSFAVGAGGFIYAGCQDKEMVSMPLDGCYTRLEGSKHSVSQRFLCRFIDDRVNEYVENSYHPLAYQEMAKHPVGTHFMIEADSMKSKNVLDKSAPAFLLGLLTAFIGCIVAIYGSTRKS